VVRIRLNFLSGQGGRKRGGMEWKVAKVWYATRRRIESMTKLVVFDDRGSLELSAGKLRFAGKKGTLEMSDLADFAITRQSVNWVTYAIVNVLLIPYFMFLETPLPLAAGILVAANAVGLVVAFRTKWIHIAFRDGAGRPGEAYFCDASSMGWGGIFGGTQKLFERLKSGG